MGEPMMHPRFFDMVAYATAKGIEVSTNSNLTLLSERRAHLCVLSGLAYLHAFLDGATAETYQEIRVRARFDRVLRNLRRLIEARRQASSGLPRVRLVAVAMRKNLHELPALVRLAHEHGVDSLFVQHLLKLPRRDDAVLHGGHTGSHQLRQYGRGGYGECVEQ